MRPWRNGETRTFQWLNHGLSCPKGASECEQRTDQHHDVYGRLIEWEGEAPAGIQRPDRGWQKLGTVVDRVIKIIGEDDGKPAVE